MVNKKALVYAGLATLATAVCYMIDSASGSTATEMGNLLMHAPQNGSPVIGHLSLMADNADRLSGAGLATIVSGLTAVGTGIAGIFGKGKKKNESSD
jgi:hypothetical protein